LIAGSNDFKMDLRDYSENVMVVYSNPFLRQAQDKLAKGDKYSESIYIFTNTIITIKLFQILKFSNGEAK
jgi:hypothetical protein